MKLRQIMSLMLIHILLWACNEKSELQLEPIGADSTQNEILFRNPIGGYEADPAVIYHEGYYYYCATSGNEVKIRKSANLHTVARAAAHTVWMPTPNGEIVNTIWAPELHRVNGKWYVYASGSPCGDFTKCFQQSFVLEANSDDPQGTYTYKGIIAEGIDGTVLHAGDEDYFVWMRTHEERTEHLSIARMKTPWQLDEGVAQISKEPFLDWETRHQHTNEGAAILQRGDTTLVIYSASASWTEWYCLGAYINIGGDLLDTDHWVKHPKPLFEKSETNRVYGPGHCSFTKSPDGTEDWIIYHALSDRHGGWGARTPRIQQFTWRSDGLPDFGAPWPSDVWFDAPAGSVK